MKTDFVRGAATRMPPAPGHVYVHKLGFAGCPCEDRDGTPWLAAGMMRWPDDHYIVQERTLSPLAERWIGYGGEVIARTAAARSYPCAAPRPDRQAAA